MTFILLLISLDISGHDLSRNRHQFSIGPEGYYVRRLKEGGTKQKGGIYGGRFSYDRFKRYALYWGAEFAGDYGTLHGHSGSGSALRSHLTDYSAEGRFGYTIQQKECSKISFTPFIGGGYFVEKNNFVNPTLIHAHFRTRYAYFTAGFFLWGLVCDQFELGLNLKAKYPYEPKCYVSHDADSEPVTQKIRTHTQYRVEVPLTYRITCDGQFALSMIPVYEYRNYGSHPNFPFDFFKTQFNCWGLTLEFLYRI